MEAASRAGRIIGVFIIIQMIGSGMVNFVMEGPLSDAPGFLVNAAAFSTDSCGCTSRDGYRGVVGWNFGHGVSPLSSTQPKNGALVSRADCSEPCGGCGREHRRDVHGLSKRGIYQSDCCRARTASDSASHRGVR